MAFWNKKGEGGKSLFEGIGQATGAVDGLIDKIGGIKLPTLNVKADHDVNWLKMMPMVLVGAGIFLIITLNKKKR